MSTLAELLGTYAAGHTLSHEGTDFTFGRIDQAAKAALTVAYFRRARESVYALKGEVEPDEYDRQLARVTDAYRRGEYAFPQGESFRYYLGDGLAELVAQLTGRDPALCEALAQERSVEVLHVCLCVVMESFPGLKKTALARPESPQTQALRSLLSTGNASPTPSATRQPGSPRARSDPTFSPG